MCNIIQALNISVKITKQNFSLLRAKKLQRGHMFLHSRFKKIPFVLFDEHYRELTVLFSILSILVDMDTYFWCIY